MHLCFRLLLPLWLWPPHHLSLAPYQPAHVSINNVGTWLISSAGDQISKALDQTWREVYIPLGIGTWDLLWEESLWVFFNADIIFGKLTQSEFVVINNTTATCDCFSYSKICFHSLLSTSPVCGIESVFIPAAAFLMPDSLCSFSSTVAWVYWI